MQSLVESVYPHLAVLRRFARGHAVSMEAADGLLLLALDKLVKRRFFVDKTAIKLEMLRIIHDLSNEAFNSGEPDKPTSQVQGQTDIAWHFSKLAPFDRSLLLLTSIEELSHEKTAWILRTSESQILPRLVQSRERLREILESRSHGRILSGGGHLRRVK